jgi:hypothetical protein
VVDKDKRIYDLRKKNQELEKFKFVLNYKIQELKRQIMPRKKEIQVGRARVKTARCGRSHCIDSARVATSSCRLCPFLSGATPSIYCASVFGNCPKCVS